jgi:NAD(P)-dependent dehydrogenase (short-subunit alcohol dehydrogenase family)
MAGMSPEGRRVIVTAGAGGIGLAIVSALVGAGARVHVCDVDEAALAACGAAWADVSDEARLDA